ncbi:MAG: chemotaxis protein CheD [Thermoguttaceae bacterium]
MNFCTTIQAEQKQTVGMGQTALAKAPALFSSVLGSCVGLALYHPRSKTGSLAHIVLPSAGGRCAMPGKFADTAVPHMLAEFARIGIPREALVAKIAGGACMFGTAGALQIGDSNIETVQQLLARENIRLVAKDVGGQKGRRVTFDCSNGEMLVEVAGRPQKIL